MSLFWFGCLFLLSLTAFFCVVALSPLSRRGDSRSANLAWYQIRRLEISAEELDADDLVTDAKLRAKDDISSVELPERQQQTFPRVILALCVMGIGLAIYFSLGSIEDVMLSERIEAMESGLDDAELSSLMLSIEDRITDRPKNPDYLNLSAEYRLAKGDFDIALHHLRKLADLVPDNAYVLATAARASFFANQQKLDDEGRAFAEESLALDPDQSISLGILGFSAFSERDYESSIDYFSRLLSSQNPSPEERAMLETYIDRARVLGSKLSNEVNDLQRKSTTSIPVRVSLPLDADFSGDETLFLSVRESNSNSKIPILAVKRSVSELPLSMVFNDSYSMMGKSLSDFDVVEVVAFVSPKGYAGEAFASWIGSSGPISVAENDLKIDVKLERKDF